jgi:hypothetical protein
MQSKRVMIDPWLLDEQHPEDLLTRISLQAA